MFKNPFLAAGYRVAALSAASALVLISACSRPEPGAEFNDPNEAQNRAVHELNIALDKPIFGGGGVPQKRYLPNPVAKGVINVAYNLSMPSAALNNILQLNLTGAAKDTMRFMLNSTVGLAGWFDPANTIGLYAEDADFGETLHVWGAPEGAYIVLPIAGPTTERDLYGSAIDFLIDPLGYVLSGRQFAKLLVIRGVNLIGERQEYRALIESILYDSADSYAQMRLTYLQYRHNKLGIEETASDPYEDFYAQ